MLSQATCNQKIHISEPCMQQNGGKQESYERFRPAAESHMPGHICTVNKKKLSCRSCQ
jgi:hypothetical protein